MKNVLFILSVFVCSFIFSEEITSKDPEIQKALKSGYKIIKNEKFSHSLVSFEFGNEYYPSGALFLLEKNKELTPQSLLLKKQPTQVVLTRAGAAWYRHTGTAWRIEQYTLKTAKTDLIKEYKNGDVGENIKIVITEQGATVTLDGTNSNFAFSKNSQAENSIDYTELTGANMDKLEGSFSGTDLTKKASQGNLRIEEEEEETARQVLQNIRDINVKKNSLLWGSDTENLRSIVNLIAHHLSQKNTKDPLYQYFSGWKVYEIGWTQLSTNGKVNISVDRARELCDLVKSKKVILYIDQVETLAGLGVNVGESQDVSASLLTAMKTGQLILIGTTSQDGISHLRNKPEFFQAFREFHISDISSQKLLAKAKNQAKKLLDKKRVEISEERIQQIIDLSDRYIHDKKQPHKTLEALEALASSWSPLKGDEDDIEAVAPVKIDERKVKNWAAKAANIPTLSEEGLDIVEKFVATGEYDKEISKKVTGQNKARESLKRALLNMTSSFKTTNAKGAELGIEVLLFVGPSGTGKTYIHTILSKALVKRGIPFPVEETIEGSTLIDGEQAVRTLLGASPGYVGYDVTGEGGLLYKMVKRSPQSIIVFEEYDKMHEDVDKTLYAFLDEGKVMNSSGKVARFSKGLVILTANYGVEGSGGRARKNRNDGTPIAELCTQIDRWDRHHLFKKGDPLHVEDAEVASWSEERLQEELFKCLKEKNLVNPQILGRIGKTNLVIFHHFTKNEIASIRDSEIEKLKQMVAQTFKSKLDVDATTLDWLMTTAWGDTGKNAFNVGARVITDLVKAEVEGTINQFLAKERKNDIREKSWNMTMAEESGVLKPTLKIAPLGDKK